MSMLAPKMTTIFPCQYIHVYPISFIIITKIFTLEECRLHWPRLQPPRGLHRPPEANTNLADFHKFMAVKVILWDRRTIVEVKKCSLPLKL